MLYIPQQHSTKLLGQINIKQYYKHTQLIQATTSS